MNDKIKDKLLDFTGRFYALYMKGWGSYLAMPLGMLAYITIIYDLLLVKFIPLSTTLYVGILAAMILVSWALGIIGQKTGIWGSEQIAAQEANPLLHRPMGSKEILSYDISIIGQENAIMGYDVSIASTQALIEVKQKLGLDTKELQATIQKQEFMRTKAEDVMNRLIAMRKKAIAG